MTTFELERCLLRPPRPGDAESLARHLDDRAIWRNLRDHVPHPYRVADAETWIENASDAHVWVVEIHGEAAGGVGLHTRDDVQRGTLEIGFWIGRAHHGRGIASEIVPVIVRHAFAEFPDAIRIEANVFDWNPVSRHILEKCGFRLEGRLRCAVTKDSEVCDLLVMSLLRSEIED